jgi:hypothetical protein
MGRRHCTLAGLLGFLALFSGCATTFASKPGKSTTAQKSNQKSKPNAAADKALAQRKKDYSSKSDDDDEVVSAAGSSQATQSTTPLGGHDPQTMAFIEQELRDATPEERANYMNSLEGMHPEAVRQVLYSRRLTMQAVQRQNASLQMNGSRGAIQTAGSSSGPTGRRLDAGEGLGSMHAWSRPGDANQTPPKIIGSGGADDANSAQPDSVAQQGSGAPPLGHSSGYHADLDPDPAQGAGFALVRPGTAPPGRATIAGQVDPVQFSVADRGVIPPSMPRGTVAKPPVVAAGVPMNASSSPQRAASVSLGANITAEGGARDQLARYISSVESEAFELQPGETDSEKQAYLEKQVHLRMLYLMSGQQERALQAIPGLDPADQEFWQHTFWGLADYFDVNSMPASADRATQTVAQMTNAVLRLQEKARLELRNVTFCYKISSFGNYEKYPRDEFSPGQEVLLYAEVANTHSEPVADGKFKTSLKSTLEIYRHGSQTELVDRIDLPETVDVCRTLRRDYFHSYQFTIPAKLALGPHVLKLTVEDQLSRRVGSYTLNFMVR